MSSGKVDDTPDQVTIVLDVASVCFPNAREKLRGMISKQGWLLIVGARE